MFKELWWRKVKHVAADLIKESSTWRKIFPTCQMRAEYFALKFWGGHHV